jgi:hypothetical protein
MAEKTYPVYSVDPTTGEEIITYPDGTVEPVTGNFESAPVASRPAGTEQTDANPAVTTGGFVPVTDTSTPVTAPVSDTSDAPASGSTYSPRGGYSGRRSYDSGGGYDGSPDGYLPQYANGGLHPSRTGGTDLAGLGDRIRAANGQPPGSSYREQIYSPSGASAGPFGTSAPSEGAAGADWAFTPSGHPTSGGGGGTHPLYDRLRAKGQAMESRVRGMASGFGSGGGGGYSSGGYSSGGYSAAAPPETPKPPRMHGEWAKGLDPTQAMELAYRPTFLLPTVFPKMSGASPAYQLLSDMPAYQLGILSKRGFDGGPSDVANAVGNFYEGAGGPKNDLPEFDKVFRNLSDPKSGGGIDQMFSGVEAGRGDQESYTSPGYVYGGEPPAAGIAAQSYTSMVDAALSLLPAPTAMKYGSEGYGGYLMDKWGSRALKRPAGKGQPINTWVGKRLMR